MISTKAGTRYKTDAEVQVKQLRRALLNVRESLVKLVNELDQKCEGSEAESIVVRHVCAMQHYIDKLT